MTSYTSFLFCLFRLFTQDPSAQDLFDQLRDIPLEELAANRKMKAHALRVAASLNSLVEGLDDIEVLIEMLNNVARTHFSHKVTKHHYDVRFWFIIIVITTSWFSK